MVDRVSEITPEYLGDGATEQDALQFKGWVRQLQTRDGLSERAAIEAIWNDGDYIAAARFGLDR